MDPRKGHEKRVVLETIVGLLPQGKTAMSVSFLAMLLRAAVYLETTIACKLDLERRIGSQLAQAALDDLLIPSFSFAGDTVFDVDAVQRILSDYLDHEADGGWKLGGGYQDDVAMPSPGDMVRVGALMDSYLAEIASDPKLTVSSFVGLAKLVPEQARTTEDGLYRAIDIYLKAHPWVTDAERKNICCAMDCHKLSREACAHAAQNRRLPMQVVVQVLCYEQERLRDIATLTAGGGGGSLHHLVEGDSRFTPSPRSQGVVGHPHGTDELARLRRANDELRAELDQMKSRLTEQGQLPPTPGKHPSHRRSFIHSVSRKLGRLNPFLRSSDASKVDVDMAWEKSRKDRRHSIS